MDSQNVVQTLVSYHCTNTYIITMATNADMLDIDLTV